MSRVVARGKYGKSHTFLDDLCVVWCNFVALRQLDCVTIRVGRLYEVQIEGSEKIEVGKFLGTQSLHCLALTQSWSTLLQRCEQLS